MIVIDKDALMDDLIRLSSDVGKMGFEWLNRDEVFETVRSQDEIEVDEWFDMKDDLPDDNGRYIVQDNAGQIGFDYWNNGWTTVADVVAWRYMPEPYRREEHATS